MIYRSYEHFSNEAYRESLISFARKMLLIMTIVSKDSVAKKKCVRGNQ